MLLVNDLKRHTSATRHLIDQAIARVVSRGWFVLGTELELFEREFANDLGVPFVIGVANGTDALELALRGIGIGVGDRVITVANAGGYSSTAVHSCGAVPVYVDVLASTMNMDPNALQDQIAGVRAVVVTHLYGRMADMPEIMAVAERSKVPIIEDCAQAHGARLQGRAAGSWGAAACFSFYPTKNLGAIGDGGAVVTTNPEIAIRIRALRQYGWSTKYSSDVDGGRNSRLDEIQAAVLRSKLPLLDGWNRRRRQIAAAYGLEVSEANQVAHLAVIRTGQRDRVREELRQRGIAAEVHYPVPDYKQLAFRQPISLPVTEQLCKQVLTLPCFPEMTDEEIAMVVQARREAETAVLGNESNAV